MNFGAQIKRILPHLGIAAIFLVMTLAYFSPFFQGGGKRLVQNDILQWELKTKEIHDHRDATGEEPLWTNSMFGGMPTYLMSLETPNNLVAKVSDIAGLGLPRPADYMFLSLLCAYIMCLCFGFNRWISLLGAIAYTFGSYNVILMEAGHNTKMAAIAYVPLAIGGAWLTLNKKFLLGFGLLAMGIALQVSAGHFQITFYMYMILGFLGLFKFIEFIQEKDMRSIGISFGIFVLASLLGIASHTTKIWTTMEYSEVTIRGGKSELKEKQAKTDGGLDKDYAYRWSYGIPETFTLLIPNFYGGASSGAVSESSEFYEFLTDNNVTKQQAKEMIKQVPTYWGDQPFTSGPVYFGALLIFLAVIGLFMMPNGPVKWWLIVTAVLTIVLSWGRHFPMVIDIFFDYFPLFNKFRVPSTILTATELVVMLLALFGLHHFIKSEDLDKKMKALKIGGGIMAGLLLMIAVAGSGFADFESQGDAQLSAQWSKAAGGNEKFGAQVVSAIQDDRASLMQADAFRSLIIILLGAGVLFLFTRGSLKPRVAILILAGITLTEMWIVDKRFLNEENFMADRKYKSQFNPSAVDRQIKKDPDIHYRVYNSTENPTSDSRTSYHHKSIGGYHAAKMIRYQDLVEKHISAGNMKVLNMLNTKYFIVQGNEGKQAQQNPGALGNAWFVGETVWAKDADEEINTLKDFDPQKQVVIDERFKDYMGDYRFLRDGLSGIKLTSYAPNELTYQIDAKGPQFAVFSEIYYNEERGWNAYLNEEKLEHIRVNYVLRGMKIPAGKNTLVFKFEPKSYFTGETISLAGSGIILLIFLFSVYKALKSEEEESSDYDEEEEEIEED